MFSIFRFKKIDFVSILLIFLKIFQFFIFNLIILLEIFQFVPCFLDFLFQFFQFLNFSLFRKIFWFSLFCYFRSFFRFYCKRKSQLFDFFKFLLWWKHFLHFVTFLVLWFSNSSIGKIFLLSKLRFLLVFGLKTIFSILLILPILLI